MVFTPMQLTQSQAFAPFISFTAFSQHFFETSTPPAAHSLQILSTS